MLLNLKNTVLDLGYKRIVVGSLETNCYILINKETNESIIIDPGAEPGKIIHEIEENNLKPIAIILTHGHIDHCSGVNELRKSYKIDDFLHKDDFKVITSFISKEYAKMLNLPLPVKPKKELKEGKLKIKSIEVEIIHTPGHSPGSITIKAGKLLFTGDTLFQGSIGRTDLPGGDFKKIQKSLKKLLEFEDNSIVLPGHGDITTIGQEKQLNPFL